MTGRPPDVRTGGERLPVEPATRGPTPGEPVKTTEENMNDAAVRDLVEILDPAEDLAAGVPEADRHNQTTVAAEIGVDWRSVHRWATGEATPKSRWTREAIARLLVKVRANRARCRKLAKVIAETPVPPTPAET